MSRDTIMKALGDEGEIVEELFYSFDNISHAGFLLGQRVGLEAAATMLSEMAGRSFRVGEDSDARMLRSAATAIQTMAAAKESERVKHEEARPCYHKDPAEL